MVHRVSGTVESGSYIFDVKVYGFQVDVCVAVCIFHLVMNLCV